MANIDQNESMYDDGTYVVKKNKKAGIVALIVCIIVSFVIWCYAKGNAMIDKKDNNDPKDTQAVDTLGSEDK